MVTGFRIGEVTVVAVAQGVSVAAVAAGAWASGAAALGPSSRATSLRGFGVIRGLSFESPQSPLSWRIPIPRPVGVSGPSHCAQSPQRASYEHDGRDVNRPKVRHPIVIEG